MTSEQARSLHLGILLTGYTPETLSESFGQYNQMFERLLAPYGFTFECYPVLEGVFPKDIAQADGWLVTGSRHGVYEPHAWIAPLESFIRAVYQQGLPLVGVCFGHQIIAQALGGTVGKFDGGWRVGVQQYHLEHEAQPRCLLAWHQDQVLVPPDGAKTLAFAEQCEHAVLLYPDRALSIQPHPEFDLPFVRGLLQARGDALPRELQEQAAQGLNHPPELDSFAPEIAHFFYTRQWLNRKST